MKRYQPDSRRILTGMRESEKGEYVRYSDVESVAATPQWRSMYDPRLEKIKKDGTPVVVWAQWDWDGMYGHKCDEEYKAQTCTRVNKRFISDTSNPYSDVAVRPLGWMPIPAATEKQESGE